MFPWRNVSSERSVFSFTALTYLDPTQLNFKIPAKNGAPAEAEAAVVFPKARNSSSPSDCRQQQVRLRPRPQQHGQYCRHRDHHDRRWESRKAGAALTSEWPRTEKEEANRHQSRSRPRKLGEGSTAEGHRPDGDRKHHRGRWWHRHSLARPNPRGRVLRVQTFKKYNLATGLDNL